MVSFGKPAPGGPCPPRTYPGISTRFNPTETLKIRDHVIRKEREGRCTHQLLEAYGKLGLDQNSAPDELLRRCDLVAGFSSLAWAYEKLGWTVQKNGMMVQPDAQAIVRQSAKLAARAGAGHSDTRSHLSAAAPPDSVLSISSQLTSLSACPLDSTEARGRSGHPEVASAVAACRKAAPSRCWEPQPLHASQPGIVEKQSECSHAQPKHGKAAREERTASSVRSAVYRSRSMSQSRPERTASSARTGVPRSCSGPLGSLDSPAPAIPPVRKDRPASAATRCRVGPAAHMPVVTPERRLASADSRLRKSSSATARVSSRQSHADSRGRSVPR